MARANNILLVRDRGHDSFALPGGGIENAEMPIIAAARELYEETTLRATSLAYLFQHGGKHNNHHVFRVEADGEVSVSDDLDVEEFFWWNRQEELSVYPHVLEILDRL